MTAGEQSPRDAMLWLTNAYQLSRATHVAAALGIADLLKDGPRSPADLAAATSTDPAALYRLLRALASAGVFAEDDGGRFGLTPMAEYLRSDVPGSVRAWATLMSRPYYWQTWAQFADSVATGSPAFPDVHGMTPWAYRAEHPDEGAVFNAAMTGMSAAVTRTIVQSYDFSKLGTVADVGGGQGELLAAVLDANPDLRGILFDLPHVVAGANALLRRAGVADRCTIVGGSFFEGVPAGADAYILKSVVHDWGDAESIQILRACRATMAEASTLLLMEQVLRPPNEPDRAKIGDLNMLVLHGGRERTADEFGRLLAEAGFRLTGIIRTDSPLCIVEAAPA